jgi:methylaspartate ammonia-lyase
MAGRDAMLVADEQVPIIEGAVSKALVGRELTSFRALADEIDMMQVGGKRLHTAVRYGVTQAILHAVSLARHRTMAEIICDEYGTTPVDKPLPIFAGANRDQWAQLDRIIIKRADVLPHTAFLSVQYHLGPQGEKLTAYVERMRARLEEVGDRDYRPKIHIDLYGTLGEAFNNDLRKMASYIGSLAKIIAPYEFLLESPIVAKSREDQITLYKGLREELDRQGVPVRIFIDEWANTLEDIKAFAAAGAIQNVQIKTPDLGGVNRTIEALIYCRQNGIEACLGGTSNETDQSARITAQIGVACGAFMVSTKPGQGADEGWQIIYNEMVRTIGLMRRMTH